MTSKTCSSCFREYPVSEFRKIRSDGERRAARCRYCHNEYERNRARRKAKKQQNKLLHTQFHKLRRDSSDQMVRTICSQMVKAFGGIDGLTVAWWQCWQSDFSRRRAKTVNHIEAIVRLLQWTESNKPDYGSLTQEELEGAISEVRSQLMG